MAGAHRVRSVSGLADTPACDPSESETTPRKEVTLYLLFFFHTPYKLVLGFPTGLWTQFMWETSNANKKQAI